MTHETLLGCDIVSLKKFAQVFSSRRRLEKVFHPLEIEECESKLKPLPSYAARFAVKEAFSKAIGTGINHNHVYFKDIWCLKGASGKPELHVSEKIKGLFPILSSQVSLSHHEDYAMAVVLLFMPLEG
jgi:holo-[acyl-carrier protein] synthase